MRRISFILFLCLSLFSAVLARAITSNFTPDRASGCAPLVVHFTPVDAPCTGCNYSWNFGTGSPIAGYTASSSFLFPGTYVVTLTVTQGTTVSSSNLSIIVHPSPTVSFSATDTAFCPGRSTTLTSTSTAGTPGPMTYSWSLGDADTATGVTVTHTYPLHGYYNIALIVTNANGCISSLTKGSYIHVYTPPTPSFTANRASICKPPGDVIFTNTTSGTPPYTYLWQFGDLTTSTIGNPTHVYSANGSYYVKLRATDAHGCKDSMTSPSYIYVATITGAFTYSDTACVFAPVTFTNTSTTHTYRQWLFGDGAVSSDINGTHTYSSPGAYTVRLVVGNSPCIDTVSHIIHIIGGPPGGYTQSPVHPCPSPMTVTYTSTAPPGTIVNWLFEKEYNRTGTTASNYYKVDSIIYTRMIKTNPVHGCKDTINTIDTLYDHIVEMRAVHDRGCIPHSTDFWSTSYTSKPDGGIHPYPFGVGVLNWSFGDGLPDATGSTTYHTYTDTGVYKVTVTGMTGNGCPINDTLFVLAGIAPAASFTATPLHACRTDTITFTADVSVGTVDSFVWDFQDYLTYSDTAQIKRPYTIPGLFTVTLTPCNNGCCGDTFVVHDYILIDSPNVEMHYAPNCPVDRQMLFFDSSLGDDTRIWVFGDGDSSFIRNPVHTYSVAAEYPIELITFNSTSGCSDRRYDTILVVDPHPDFIGSPQVLCEDDSVTFTFMDTNALSMAQLSFRWLIGDSLSYFNNIINYPFWFHQPGSYTIKMISIDDNNCLDTVTKVDYILKGKPIAGFTANSFIGCLPLTVTFTDTSVNFGGLTDTNFKWDFGDTHSVTTTTNTITHTYTAAGIYTVRDIVTNSIGCKDTTTATITVRTASAVFAASNRNLCMEGITTFVNTSPGITGSYWTFGDGGTSTLTSPTHSYIDTGLYHVILAVIDTNGCRDTARYFDYIHVAKPHAAFAMTDTISVCSPFLAQFLNLSTGAATYNWKFGDGNTSIVPSPTNYYLSPGLYTTTLIATSMYGCKDTTTLNVTAYGYPGAFTYTPVSGCNPLTVHFSSALINVPHITWDFADGHTSVVTATDTISHTYTAPGAFIPKLILSDNSGCTTSSIGTDTIKVSQVIAKFTTTPNPVCPGTAFTLVDTSTTYWSPITAHIWTYDGITSFATSPTHTITVPGTYPIHMQATNGWGCTATKDTTLVVTGMSPILGIAQVCSGKTTVLSDTAHGGTWSVSNTTIASVTTINDSATTLTGLTSGTVTVTYTLLGCYKILVVTVNQTPPAITGTLILCQGKTTTLGNTLTTGTWVSSNTGIATIGTGTGLVNGILAGAATISYIVPGACYTTSVVTVDISPDTITGLKEFCSSSTTVFGNSVAGGTWSSSDTSITKIAATGIAIGVSIGTATITYAIGDCITTTTVTVNNSIPEITGLTQLCAGDTTTLHDIATGGIWASSDTVVAAIHLSTGKVTGITGGSVLITYSLGGGCRDTAMMTIISLPDAGVINGPGKVCVGSMITLSDTVGGGTWGSTNVHGSISGTGIFTGLTAGIDTVSYTVTGPFCTNRTKIAISIAPLPDPGVITGNSPVCAGAAVTLNETIMGGKWRTSNASIATVDSIAGVLTAISSGTTIIVYTIIDTNGCIDSTTFSFTVTPPQFTIIGSITNELCYGDANGSIMLQVTGTPPFEYMWSTGGTTALIDSLPIGTYSVSISQPATHCTLVDSFRISQPDSMSLTIESIPDTCRLSRGSLTIIAFGGTSPYTYVWSDSTGQKGITSTINALRAGVYTLMITDANNCVDTAHTILAEERCRTVIIHDVITPNNDGTNDKWVIEGLHLYPNNIVQIFDKWGDKVYEKQSYEDDWYGQDRNNRLLPDGTYYYIVKLNEENKTGGETEFSGTVLVKR